MRIPVTIPECFEILDAVVDEPSKENIRSMNEMDLVDLHFDLGMFIRNNWLYDQNSPFVKSLRLKGLNWLHEDDVSLFLIKAYWRYLNGKPFDEETFIEQFLESVTAGYS
jgi:hypothetical protein